MREFCHVSFVATLNMQMQSFINCFLIQYRKLFTMSLIILCRNHETNFPFRLQAGKAQQVEGA